MKTSLRSLALILTFLLAPSAWAVSIYALTTGNKLLLLDAAVPANVSSTRDITGLDVGDDLVAIDVRPATGQLYALSRDASLYTIAPATAYHCRPKFRRASRRWRNGSGYRRWRESGNNY